MKKIISLHFVLLLTLFYFCGYSQSLKPADSLNNAATVKLKNNDYIGSLELAQQSLKTDRTNIRTWILVARSYYFLNDLDNAISTAEEALKLFPNSDTLNNVIGASYREMYQYDKALTFFEKAIKLNSKYSHPYVNIETIYQNKRDYQKLISAYNRHLKVLPASIDVYLKRADAFENIHDYDNAIKDYKTYLLQKPEEKSIYNKIAACYFYMHNYEEAVANYNLSGSSPNDPKIYNWKEIIETLQKGNFIYPCIWGDCEYGKGVYVNKSGDIFTGKWINNIFNYGIAVYKNKSFYIGQFDNDYKKNGFGSEKTSDGKIKTGYFTDDIFCGQEPVKSDLSRYREKKVFYDDFDKPDNKWTIRNPDSTMSISYKDSKLILSNNSDNSAGLLHAYNSDLFSGDSNNFMIECTFKTSKISNPGYSVIRLFFSSGNFLPKEKDKFAFPPDYNTFSMSGNYTPIITKTRDKKSYSEPYYCNSFPLSNGNTYNMTIIVSKDIVRAYINDTYIGFAEFKPLGNNLGFLLTDKITVEIDNVSVYSYSLK